MVLTVIIPRSTGKEFALKIIDKAKCCGKVQYVQLLRRKNVGVHGEGGVYVGT